MARLFQDQTKLLAKGESDCARDAHSKNPEARWTAKPDNPDSGRRCVQQSRLLHPASKMARIDAFDHAAVRKNSRHIRFFD
jgi:hypothetical protein